MKLEELLNSRQWCSLGISIDVDWAPDFVLESLIKCLKENQVKATFFATHPSELLKDLADSDQFEIGIHPNFYPNSSQGKNFEQIMQTLVKWYPQAIGTRSHGLVQSSRDIKNYLNYGLKYDSNLQLYDQAYLLPFYTFSGLLRLPFVWSDASHLLFERSFDFESIKLVQPGLKIITIHPIIWYLNANNALAWESLNESDIPLNELGPDTINKLLNRDEKGVQTLFDELIEEIKRRNVLTYLLNEVMEMLPKT